MNVQFTMTAPLEVANGPSTVPSLDTDRSPSAACESASSLITVAASRPALESIVTFASEPLLASWMIDPPAPSISALIQTTYPSYLLACTPTVPPLSLAALMIWSHVTGLVMSRPAFWANDLRYQSSCVLAHSGATTSLPFQVAPSTAPDRVV